MKIIHWIILIFSIVVIPLTAILLITRVFLDPPKSWWWFGGTILFYFIIGIISLVIFLIVKSSKKEGEIKTEVDPVEAIKKAILEKQMEEDNPDNFVIEDKIISNVGEKGSPRTSILWLTGHGSELGNRIDAIINLSDKNQKISWLNNATDNKVKYVINGMAENPEHEITEERIMGLDEFGRPTTKTITKKVSENEKKEEQAKEEADKANTI
jgi:hypothetical protein